MITVIEVNNPFDPIQGVKRHCCGHGLTILEWLELANGGNWERFSVPTICVVNGQPILQKDFSNYRTKDGDIVSFVIVPGSIVSFVVAIIISLISIAISLLLVPKPQAGQDQPEADPTFTLRGKQNRSRLGQPVPSHFGTVRNWPAYGAIPYNQYIGNDQFQFSLYCLGQGTYDVSEMKIEDADISTFQLVETQLALPGEKITLFPDTVETSPLVGSIELFGPNEDDYSGSVGPFPANDAGTKINRLEVDIVLPRGLHFANDNGGLSELTAEALFEYREIDNNGNPVTGATWEILTEFSQKMRTVTPQRFTVSQAVDPGRYEVRAVRTNNKNESHRAGNKIVWEAMRAFFPSTQKYGDLTMLAVKAKATNNLNDQSRSRFNVRQTRKLRTYDPVAKTFSERVATRNPAWAFLEIFTSAYGGQLEDQFIDLETLATLADTFDTNGDNFDWTFENLTSVWEAGQIVMQAARSIPMLNGSQITAVRDEPKTIPTAVFTPDNMISESFKWSMKMFTLLENDGIEVEYIDPVTWEPETVLCTVGFEFGENPEKLKLPGITDRDKAYQMGMYRRARQVYEREALSFTTGLEGRIPGVLTLASVSHDVPRWGDHGAVVDISADGLSVTVSDPFDYDPAKTYYIAFRNKKGESSKLYEVVNVNFPNVTVDEVITEDLARTETQEPVFYQIGTIERQRKLVKIKKIGPGENDTVSVEATNYDDRVFNFDNATAPPIFRNGPAKNDSALPVVKDLKVEGLATKVDKAQLSWTAAAGATNYVVEISYDGTNYSQLTTTINTSLEIDVNSGAETWLRVAGIGRDVGPWATWQGFLNATNDPPADVTNMVLGSSFTDLIVDLNFDEDPNVIAYKLRVYRNSNSAHLLDYEAEKETDSVTFLGDLTGIKSAFAGSPERDLDIELFGINIFGQSTNPGTLTINNLTPSFVSNLSHAFVDETVDHVDVEVTWDEVENDIDSYFLYADETSGFIPGAGNLILETDATSAIIRVDKPTPSNMYYILRAKDVFGPEEVDVSTEREIIF